MLGCQLSSITSMLPRNRQNCAGSWMGVMWVICAPFAITGPTIGGELKKRYGLREVGYFSVGCLVVAMGCLGGSALSERRRKRTTQDMGEEGHSGEEYGDEELPKLEASNDCRPCQIQGHV